VHAEKGPKVGPQRGEQRRERKCTIDKGPTSLGALPYCTVEGEEQRTIDKGGEGWVLQ